MLKTRRRSAGSYHEAMTFCPDARKLEFSYPIELAAPGDHEVMVDFPSAGGYPGPYLHQIAPTAVYHAVEHAPEYKNAGLPVIEGTWDSLPFGDQSVDIVLTLAALHHVYPGREMFYQESHRILQPGGRLIIADVADGTAADRFLSEFVNEFSPEGHVARFFNEGIDVPEIEREGFMVSHYEICSFHWFYPDKQTAIQFCKGLFRLGLASDDQIWQALNTYLGVEVDPGEVRMGWQLAMIRADKIG